MLVGGRVDRIGKNLKESGPAKRAAKTPVDGQETMQLRTLRERQADVLVINAPLMVAVR